MKRWKKIIGSSLLCAAMLFSNVTPLVAADKLDVIPVLDEQPTGIAYAPNTNATLKLNTYLGAEGDIVSWLKSHEHDDYYLKTPYSGNIKDPESCVRPRGEYRNNPSMNCTGFVAAVMKAMGADLSKLTDRLGGEYANGCNWTDTVSKMGIQSYRYKSIPEMLKSGKLEKGDVLYFEPDWTKPGSDCHLGFFWGDTSSEDKFWHQTLADTNAITNIKSGTPYEYIYIFKTQKKGTLKLEVSAMSNAKANLQGTAYGLYDSNGKLVATLSVGSDNTVTKKNLNVGTYTLNKKKTTSGYSKDNTSYKVTVTNGNVTTKKLQLKKCSATFQVTVTSSNTELTEQNKAYSLEGATFKLYDNSKEKVYYLTTNKSGNAKVTGIPQGSYKVKMLEPSKGYKLDTKTYEVVLNGTKTEKLVIEEKPMGKTCEHLWNEKDAKVLVEPSSSSQGEKAYVCEKCGQKKTEILPQVTALEKPKLLSATVSDGKITIKWNKVTYAKGYYIYRKTSDGEWEKIATVTGGSKTVYTDQSPIGGKTNIYTVRAFDGSVRSGFESKGVKAYAVQMPKLLSATYKNKKVSLNWKKVYRAEGYRIYRKVKGGKWTKIATVKAGVTSYIDKAVVADKIYTYRVRAYIGDNVSLYDENGISVKTSNTSAKYVKYKTTENVNYRVGVGTGCAKAGTLPKGTTVQVVSGYSKKANGYTWYQVKISGKTYYMVANYLKKI